MFVSLLMLTSTDLTHGMWDFNTDYDPLIWLTFLIISIYIVNMHNKFTWWSMAILTVICFIIILGLSIIGITQFSWSQLGEGWSEEVLERVSDLKHATHNQSPNVPSDFLWFGSIGGIMNALHSSAWWWTGLECASLATKEAKAVRQSVPFALIGSWIALGLCACLFTVFAILVPPGAGENASAAFPGVTLLSAVYGERAAFWGYVLMWPSIIANMFAMIWCASRQTWALSRCGYLPAYLSITSKKSGVPQRAVLFVCGYSYLMALLVHYMKVLHGELPGTQVLLGLTVIAGVVTYIGIATVYIAFHYVYPDAPRPFRNPVGMLAPIVTIIVSLSVLIAKVGSTVFQLTVLGYVVKMSISGFYYIIHGRLHLKPTEDALLAPFWKAAREGAQKRRASHDGRGRKSSEVTK